MSGKGETWKQPEGSRQDSKQLERNNGQGDEPRISNDSAKSNSREASPVNPMIHLNPSDSSSNKLDETLDSDKMAEIMERAGVQSPITRTDDRAPLVEDVIGNSDGTNSRSSGTGRRRRTVRVQVAGREIVVNHEDLLPLSEHYDDFKKMPTIPVAVISMLLSVAMISSVFAVPIWCINEHGPDVTLGHPSDGEGHDSDNMCSIPVFSMLIYIHCFYWFCHLFIDIYLKFKHKDSRMRGYLYFYDETKNMRRAPFYLLSIGNAGMLIAGTVLHDYCEAWSCPHPFMRVDWLRGLITLEAMSIFCVFIYYIHYIHVYNKEKPFPDCMRPEYMDALGTNLVLKFPKQDDPPCPPEEERHVAGMNEQTLGRLEHRNAFVFGRTWREEDKYVRILQAELISFFITQIKRKNRKIQTLSSHLARFTNDFSFLREIGLEEED